MNANELEALVFYTTVFTIPLIPLSVFGSVGTFAIFRFPFRIRIFLERLFPYPYYRILITVTV